MKKTSLTTLVLSFVLLLASCANNSDSNQKSDSAATEVEVKNDTGATPQIQWNPQQLKPGSKLQNPAMLQIQNPLSIL